MTPLLLDHRGDALPPAGSLVIERESDLLDAMLSCLEAPHEYSCGALLVRGAALCDWAEKVWRGRDWPCRNWHSPVEALLESFPTLSRADGARLWEELGATRESLPQPYLARDLLQVLYPAFDWHSQPSHQHAALWLLWLDENATSSHHAILLEAQARLWRAGDDHVEPLYVALAADAKRVLRSWLHLENGRADWGEFPVTPPSRWIQQTVNHHQARLTREGGGVWEEWRRLSLPLAILEATANATASFLAHQRAQATPMLVNSLLPFVAPAEAVRLRALCPPADPGMPPQRASEVLEWVTRRYLDYRLWQAESSDEDARARAEHLARTFGKWYLDWYSGAVVGIGARHLATRCAEDLRLSDESAVVFWVIADGLGWADAQSVMHFLTNRDSRLTVAREEPVFATIPTITHFCKRALRWSATPAAVHNGTLLAATRRETEVSGHRDAARVLETSQAGDIVIWMPQEPDKTYHEIADRSVAHTNVDGALRALGENILAAVSAVPSSRALRIVLSTDHGRLSGSSRRRHRVPSGCESHGRAAYRNDGAFIPRSYDESGVCIEGDLAWLDPDRFALPHECAVPLDDGAFLTNHGDGPGRGGVEEFPHGGVFPEEVVVPWIEIERDALALIVSAHIAGRARPGVAGRLQVRIENTNALLLHVEALTLKIKGQDQAWARDDEIAPYSTLGFEIEISSWPLGSALQGATAGLSLRRPDGRQFSVVPVLALEAEELQSRDENILGDMTV